MLSLACSSLSFQATARPAVVQSRSAPPLAAFKAPQATDSYLEDQQRRLDESGLSPKEYEVATRSRAKAYLSEQGAHVMDADAAGPEQTASFLKQLWDVDSIPAVPAAAAGDDSRVLATFYEIGGPLTSVLSTSVAKQLPMIPHVGIRMHGVEYFYSDHIECRTVPVMEEMLGDRPRVTLDIGAATMPRAELEATVAAMEAEWDADAYHVFDKNCVHFADALAARVSDRGLPQPLVQGVVDVSERMLDSLPEWRRALGRRVMNEVTRLVVVSWGKASKEKKEQAADNLGVDRGA